MGNKIAPPPPPIARPPSTRTVESVSVVIDAENVNSAIALKRALDRATDTTASFLPFQVPGPDGHIKFDPRTTQLHAALDELILRETQDERLHPLTRAEVPLVLALYDRLHRIAALTDGRSEQAWDELLKGMPYLERDKLAQGFALTKRFKAAYKKTAYAAAYQRLYTFGRTTEPEAYRPLLSFKEPLQRGFHHGDLVSAPRPDGAGRVLAIVTNVHRNGDCTVGYFDDRSAESPGEMKTARLHVTALAANNPLKILDFVDNVPPGSFAGQHGQGNVWVTGVGTDGELSGVAVVEDPVKGQVTYHLRESDLRQVAGVLAGTFGTQPPAAS